jgi:hypothetical protein
MDRKDNHLDLAANSAQRKQPLAETFYFIDYQHLKKYMSKKSKNIWKNEIRCIIFAVY